MKTFQQIGQLYYYHNCKSIPNLLFNSNSLSVRSAEGITEDTTANFRQQMHVRTFYSETHLHLPWHDLRFCVKLCSNILGQSNPIIFSLVTTTYIPYPQFRLLQCSGDCRGVNTLLTCSGNSILLPKSFQGHKSYYADLNMIYQLVISEVAFFTM